MTRLIWLMILIFIFAGCSPKTNCGTKKQHKVRFEKTKRMAPSMSH